MSSSEKPDTSDQEEVECPECLEDVTQDELDMFGGVCENCREDLDFEDE